MQESTIICLHTEDKYACLPIYINSKTFFFSKQ